MTLRKLLPTLIGGVLLALPLPARAASAWFYVGTYTPARGIFGVSIDLTTGKLSPPRLMADLAVPSFLDIDLPHGRLFSTTDGANGAVAGFKIDSQTHGLTAINTVPAGGALTTYVTVTDDGRAVLAANYTGGTVSLMPVDALGLLKSPAAIDRHTGTGPDKSRQTAPHPHAIQIDPTERFALSCDLGNDKIYVYAIDSANAKLTLRSAFAMPPGSGPRHLTFSTGGHFCYVVSELSSTVTFLKWDSAAGKLSSQQTVSLLPAKFTGAHRGCEVLVHPNGKFLYAVDRGPDLISCFTIDPKTGKLTEVAETPAGGVEARHFATTPDGKFLIVALQNANQLGVFRIDTTTGKLTPVGQTPTTRPSCIVFAQ